MLKQSALNFDIHFLCVLLKSSTKISLNLVQSQTNLIITYPAAVINSRVTGSQNWTLLIVKIFINEICSTPDSPTVKVFCFMIFLIPMSKPNCLSSTSLDLGQMMKLRRLMSN